jgi:outer membrane protein assembly factor BamB
MTRARKARSPALWPVAVASALIVACTSASSPTPVSPTPPSSASGAPVSSSPAAGASWLTYQHDAARSGVADGTTSVGTPRLAWRSPVLDGAVYAQPLVSDGRVIVATENDSLYALSEDRGRVVWRAHLGEAVPRSALPCGNIDPTGITGTPVIDLSSGLVFAVAFVQPGVHELVGVDAETGHVRVMRRIDAPGSDPLVEQQRGALTLANGRIYVPYGGLFGDCGPYHGFVVSVGADGHGPLRSYRVPTGRAGGIWAPSGLTVGPGGDLFAATGNSDSTSVFDLGDSVLRLSPSLRLVDSFAPEDWAALNSGDVDLGSVGPAIVGSDLVFQVGKGGVGYLLRAGHLGGIGGQLHSAPVCSAAFGATAQRRSTIFVPCVDGLVAVRVRSDDTFSIEWRGPAFDAGPPVVAGGLVWCLDLGAGVLYGFDATTGRVLGKTRVGSVTHFTAPSIAGDRIVVAATTQILSYLAG